MLVSGMTGGERAVETADRAGLSVERAASSDSSPRIAERQSELGVVFFELRQMSQQFVFVGQADEVVADHLISAQGRLAAHREADEHAGNNRQIGLDFDAAPVVTEQMPTAKHMLEEAEEELDGEAVLIQQSDDFRWRIQ